MYKYKKDWRRPYALFTNFNSSEKHRESVCGRRTFPGEAPQHLPRHEALGLLGLRCWERLRRGEGSREWRQRQRDQRRYKKKRTTTTRTSPQRKSSNPELGRQQREAWAGPPPPPGEPRERPRALWHRQHLSRRKVPSRATPRRWLRISDLLWGGCQCHLGQLSLFPEQPRFSENALWTRGVNGAILKQSNWLKSEKA